MSDVVVNLVTRDGVKVLPDVRCTNIYRKIENKNHLTKPEVKLVKLYNSVKDKYNFFAINEVNEKNCEKYRAIDGFLSGYTEGLGLTIKENPVSVVVSCKTSVILMCEIPPVSEDAKKYIKGIDS